jgi:hypothetical protein
VPALVGTLNVVRDFATGLAAVVEHLPGNHFLIQCGEKAFDRVIIVAFATL